MIVLEQIECEESDGPQYHHLKRRCFLLPIGRFMCGRKPGTPGERRIHLLGSPALSRDHAELVVSESISAGGRAVLELSVIDKRSKFGTYVNGGERLIADKAYPICVNDVISFGTVGNSCKVRVEEFPVVVCSSRMHSTADKQIYADSCKALGASTCKSIMDRGVTHLVVNSKMVPTMKLILAAARGIPIVTVGYLQTLAGILGNGSENIRNLSDPLPCTSDYAPILSGGDKKKVTADLGVQEWRRTHLSNFIFLCCKESLHDLHHILEAAGGKAITVPEDAKDLISFLSGRPWRRVEYQGRKPVWMPTEQQVHMHNKGGGEFSPLFNMIWLSDGAVVKLTDKQKLLYTILTRCDFIVTSMEHLYCRTSLGRTVNDGDQKTETGNFGDLATNLTSSSNSGGNLVTSSGQQQQPVKEELGSEATSHDVGIPTTSLQLRPARSTLDHKRGLSRAAATDKEQVVFGATKSFSRQQPTMSALNVTEKENNTVMQHRKRKVVAEELATKGPVPISLFGDMSENSSTVIATKAKMLDDCNVPLPPQQLPGPNGWVQFLGRRNKKDRHHHAIRQEKDDDKKSVVVKQEEEMLSPADTNYVKLVLSEEERRVAIPKTLHQNYDAAATKYGVGRSSYFRKNIVPPPPLNPVSMEMLIEMAPTATDKDLEIQREADRLEKEERRDAAKTEAEWRRDGDYSSTELFKKKSLVTF